MVQDQLLKYAARSNQSLFVLTLAKEKIPIPMEILTVKIRVLAAWNNHRG